MSETEERQLYAQVLKGNAEAVEFVYRLFEIAHFWDDLIDRDRVVADAAIHRNMTAALVDLPLNPFYQRHQGTLMPLVINSLRNWQVATDLERDGGEEQEIIAFVLRSSYIDILVMCAQIIGGFEWAWGWCMKLRLKIHGEGFQKFKESLARETAARNKEIG